MSNGADAGSSGASAPNGGPSDAGVAGGAPSAGVPVPPDAPDGGTGGGGAAAPAAGNNCARGDAGCGCGNTLAATCRWCSITEVQFSFSPSQLYGYDDFDTPGNPLDDHICIKKSDHTYLVVDIHGGAVGTDLSFVCDDTSVCMPVAPPANASFELELDAGSTNKGQTTLRAKCKCPAATEFAHIAVHVYKERVVEVVVAKIDKTSAGSTLRFPTADYAAHAPTANAKLKEGVVKYNISNFDSANGVTPVTFSSGTGVLTFDINSNGGADLDAIKAAMTGTGTKVRVAIIRDMKSNYFLSAAASKGDTNLTVKGGSTFYHPGDSPTLGTGATSETISITAANGNKITCAALQNDHAVGDPIDFPAAGWSTDPILIIEGSDTLDVAKWTILHEVGHRDRGLQLADIIDRTDFMNFDQSWTDYRLRYCPRKKRYPAGTTDVENQWETIPRD